MSYIVHINFKWCTDVVEAHPLPQRFPLEIALLEIVLGYLRDSHSTEGILDSSSVVSRSVTLGTEVLEKRFL